GKTAIVEPDQKTEDYTNKKPPEWLYSDKDADYIKEISYRAENIEPKIAKPHQVDNVVDVGDVSGRSLDQVFIGSCTNGRYEDLETVSEVLGDREFSDGIRTIIVPASRDIYNRALQNGLLEQFSNAGAVVQAPSCGPCMGGSYGLLGDGEVGLATSNRNFKGREGSPKAKVYLSSPAVAAESAVYGEITDPRGGR
ncbi:3-isopropylmalate dehydratase large subunit, partial [archaeon SCG-AAA382B04]